MPRVYYRQPQHSLRAASHERLAPSHFSVAHASPFRSSASSQIWRALSQIASPRVQVSPQVPGGGDGGSQLALISIAERVSGAAGIGIGAGTATRSEERRVGKECRARWSAEQ